MMKLQNRHKDILSIIALYPDGARESFIISVTKYHFSDVKIILADLVDMGEVEKTDNKYKLKK